MKGDPLKLKKLCPEWDKCLDEHMQEFEFESVEEAEADLAYNWCCGCVHCVLLRHKVGCGDECHVRKKYPQYQDDDALFNIAVSWDPEEIYEELYEDYGMEPDLLEIVKEGIRRQREKAKQLNKILEEKESETV
jgi:hypothetical protein